MHYGKGQESEARAHDAFREDGPSASRGDDLHYWLLSEVGKPLVAEGGIILDANLEAHRSLRHAWKEPVSARFDCGLALDRWLPSPLRRTS